MKSQKWDSFDGIESRIFTPVDVTATTDTTTSMQVPALQHLPEPEDLNPFQFGILVLSVALLAGLAAEIFLPLPTEVGRLIFFIDTTICALLFIDWIYRFSDAKSKAQFMKLGWLDLLACIPAVEPLRWLRVFRIVRLLLAVRTFDRFKRVLVANKTSAGLSGVAVIAVLMVSFGSAAILLFEHQNADGNIKTAEDALWWAIVTTTTVGYGDLYPITTAGRIVAVILMVTGIGLFGTLSGVAASFFLGEDQDKPASLNAQKQMLQRLEKLQEEMQAMHGQIADDEPAKPSREKPVEKENPPG